MIAIVRCSNERHPRGRGGHILKMRNKIDPSRLLKRSTKKQKRCLCYLTALKQNRSLAYNLVSSVRKKLYADLYAK